MIQISIHLSLLRKYFKRSVQTTVISVMLFALWSCQRHNAGMGKDRVLLPIDLKREEIVKLDSTIDNQLIVESVHIEYKLAKDLGSIVDLMVLLPEVRTPWENRLRMAGAVGTGLTAISGIAAIAFYFYSWYVQKNQDDSQTDHTQACFYQLHQAIEGYANHFRSYVAKQKGQLYHEPSEEGTRPAMLTRVESSFQECSRHEAELSRCLSTAVLYTSYVYDVSWMSGLYRFSTAFGVATLGCFAGKEFFGRSTKENQQNRELIALKECTIEAYKQIKEAWERSTRTRNTDLLHAKARADLKKFFAKASEVLCSLVGRKQDLLTKLQDPIHHLAVYCEKHDTSIAGDQSHREVLKACNFCMRKVLRRITPEKSNMCIRMNDISSHGDSGDDENFASTSRIGD
ncbi:hypothetical protein [Candidatus Cardinium hertigii]|nr:hypothetical protein [Candidatus Cardinium hertigii]